MKTKTISITKTTYEKLLQKARMLENFLSILQENYPLEEYSNARLAEFKKTDQIPNKLRKQINAILKTNKIRA